MNDAEFNEVDRRLFERLHGGSLAPVTFRLKDGGSVTGQPLSIRRLPATGAAASAPEGEIRLACGAGETLLSYAQIAGIE